MYSNDNPAKEELVDSLKELSTALKAEEMF